MTLYLVILLIAALLIVRDYRRHPEAYQIQRHEVTFTDDEYWLMDDLMDDWDGE